MLQAPRVPRRFRLANIVGLIVIALSGLAGAASAQDSAPATSVSTDGASLASSFVTAPSNAIPDTTHTPPLCVRLTKSADLARIAPGDTLTYRIRWEVTRPYCSIAQLLIKDLLRPLAKQGLE